METQKNSFDVKVEYCVRSNYKEDYEIIKEAIHQKWPEATVEGIGGGIGALEVILTIPDKTSKKVYSMLENNDSRVDKNNVNEVISRIQQAL